MPIVVIILKRFGSMYLSVNFFTVSAASWFVVLCQGFSVVWLDIVILVGMGLVCFVTSLKLFRWE